MEEEKEEHFYRLVCLVLDVGTDVVLNLFTNSIPQGQAVGAFLKNRINIIDGLRRKKVINETNYIALTAVPVDVTKFDISLLCILISNLTSIQPPTGGWNNQAPLASDTSPGARLINLRAIRNTAIAHKSTCKFKKSEFEKYWQETEAILVGLAGEVGQADEAAVKLKIEETKVKQLFGDQKCKANALVVQTLQDDYTHMDTTIYQMKQKVDEHENMKVDVGSLKASIVVLEHQLKGLENSISQVDDKSTNVDQQLKHVSADMDQLKSAVQNNESRLLELKTEISTRQNFFDRILWTTNITWLRWTLFITLCGAVLITFWPAVKTETRQGVYTTVGLIFIFHLLLAVGILVCDQLKGLSREKQTRSLSMTTDYDTKKKELQKDIIDYYMQLGVCKISMPADEVVDVDKLSMKPILKKVTHGTAKNSTGGTNDAMISSLKELIQQAGSFNRRICISGDAGKGKSTLCQALVSSWCKLSTGQENVESFNEEFLKSFDFLFYIPLQNHALSDVVTMIKKDIVRKDRHGLLETVLQKESEKCLFILDGLDEWMPPKECKNKFPYVDPREKFTVLFTTRPWKLEVVRLKVNEIGQEVELHGMSVKHTIDHMVHILNDKYGKGKYHFMDSEQYEKAKHLAKIPIILVQMVCMWYDDEQLGNTRVEAYQKMLDHMFSAADKRHQQSDNYTWPDSLKSTNTNFDNVLSGATYCSMYSHLLFKLSDLAYHTLFNEQKENSLVFPRSTAGIYMLTEDDISFCLFVGLLSQSRFCGKATLQQKKLSFLHKTVQEFFAALFIAHGGDDTCFDKVLSAIKSLDDVFEMSEVLIFLCGLRPDNISKISRHVAQLADQDGRVFQYRHSLSGDEFIIKTVQDLIHKCIDEIPKDTKLDSMIELHDIYYADWPEETLQYLDRGNIKSFVKSVRYTRRSFDSSLKWPGQNLVRLDVKIESQENVNNVVRLMERCALSLSYLNVKHYATKQFPANWNDFVIALQKINHLTYLGLAGMHLAHKEIIEIGKCISQSFRLMEIFLCEIECISCNKGQCIYSIDLRPNKLLMRVDFQTLEGDFILCTDIPLEQCLMENMKFSASILNRLAFFLSLRKLTLATDGTTDIVNTPTRCTPGHGLNGLHVRSQSWSETNTSTQCLARELTDVIPTCVNLRELVVWNVDFKQIRFVLTPKITNLKLIMIHITMTLECFQALMESAPQSVNKLEFRGTFVCSKEELTKVVDCVTQNLKNASYGIVKTDIVTKWNCFVAYGKQK